MSDPKVEEIRARQQRLGEDFANPDIDHLLTKLDEAERGRKVYEGLYAEAESEHDDLQTRLNAAEERERTLIAGVKEALEIKHGEFGPWDDDLCDYAQLSDILSRLLRTEEAINNEN